MKGIITGSAALAGAVGTVGAVALLPWAKYGSVEVALYRFPGWGMHVAAAVGLNLFVGWVVWAGVRAASARSLILAGAVLLAASVGSAVLVISRYDDGTALLGPIVPMVVPTIWLGGPVAMAAAVLSAAALVGGVTNGRTADRHGRRSEPSINAS